MKPIPEDLARRLHREAHAERWAVPLQRFTEALQACADRSAPVDVARYLSGLHLEDVALACACADGDDHAWEHFMREHRPVLYRAADAIDPTPPATIELNRLIAPCWTCAAVPPPLVTGMRADSACWLF